MNITWDEEKNQMIQCRAGGLAVSFEEIEDKIMRKDILFEKNNPKIKYSDQNIFIINIRGYPFVVPYRFIDKDTIYLITAYPDRNYKKHLLQ